MMVMLVGHSLVIVAGLAVIGACYVVTVLLVSAQRDVRISERREHDFLVFLYDLTERQGLGSPASGVVANPAFELQA